MLLVKKETRDQSPLAKNKETLWKENYMRCKLTWNIINFSAVFYLVLVCYVAFVFIAE